MYSGMDVSIWAMIRKTTAPAPMAAMRWRSRRASVHGTGEVLLEEVSKRVNSAPRTATTDR